MAINPMQLLQYKNLLDGFTRRHPKFPQFFSAVRQHGISEGTIIEVQITTPEGKNFTSNIRITAEDMEAIQQLKNLQ